jgi:hypothetical protein
MVPHRLGDDQKRTRVQLAVSLQAELEKAQQRNWTEFYIGDEFWALWKNLPRGSWLNLNDSPNRYVEELGPRSQC